MKKKKVLNKTKYAIYLLVVHLICILYMHTFHYKQNSDTFMGSLVRDDTLSLDKLSYLCMRVNSHFPNGMLLAIFD